MPGAVLAGAAASLDPIATDSGFAILPTHDFASAPQADILCIPGGHGVTEALNDAATIDFIARQAAGAEWVTSVCTGAFLLGRAELLAGKRSEEHTSELQSLMRSSYAVLCLKKKKYNNKRNQ